MHRTFLISFLAIITACSASAATGPGIFPPRAAAPTYETEPAPDSLVSRNGTAATYTFVDTSVTPKQSVTVALSGNMSSGAVTVTVTEFGIPTTYVHNGTNVVIHQPFYSQGATWIMWIGSGGADTITNLNALTGEG